MKQMMLGNREVTIIPWVAQAPKPRRDGYERVHIPFTETELKNGTGRVVAHEQIVRRDHLKPMAN